MKSKWHEYKGESIINIGPITVYVKKDRSRKRWVAKTNPLIFTEYVGDVDEIDLNEARAEALEFLRKVALEMVGRAEDVLI